MNKLKKTLLIMAALLLVFAMTACSVDPSDDGSDMKTITVEMNIDFPDADDEEFELDEYPADIEDYEMQVEDGATVMQILEAFATQQNLDVVVDESSATVYVTSIGGVAAGGNTGWIYEINDESVMEEAAKCVPANGDEITWEFISF